MRTLPRKPDWQITLILIGGLIVLMGLSDNALACGSNSSCCAPRGNNNARQTQSSASKKDRRQAAAANRENQKSGAANREAAGFITENSAPTARDTKLNRAAKTSARERGDGDDNAATVAVGNSDNCCAAKP